MNIKYTVRFYNRNAQDEQDRNTIQRETFHGCNETDVREVYEDNGLEIVDIVETSKLVDTLYAKIDELNATIANLNEGAKIMHAFATGGESKLLADWQTEAEALSAEQADLAERASGCWTSYTPSAKELSKRVQPEMKEAQEVADNFNFDEIKPIKF